MQDLTPTHAKDQHVVIHGAYLVALFPPTYENDFDQLGVSVFGDSGQRSPVIIENKIAAIVQVNKQSISPVPDMNHWKFLLHKYDREHFLWLLVRNNDAGSYF